MFELYVICFVTGIVLIFLSLIFGDMVDGIFSKALDALDSSVFNSTVLLAGVTTFGGVGILLTKYSAMAGGVLACSVLFAVASCTLVYFLYVKPAQNAENSVAFSLHQLSGKLCEVITTIPATGFGEVLVKVGAGVTNQIAASFDGEEIRAGEQAVIVEVKDGTLYVTKFQ
ncbi:NfeD family protein [Paenibacillus sp. EPM92]|uniref:NfeD family protein n=1 Tax=Paenibacillus sp. EPM92 TaxID=1561195 RepID=UPI001915DE5A|nr:NfeD family protein [Paenibacillus sp. EPM92]